MYGFPLTIYLLSGWLGSRYPGVNILSHNTGHLWETLLGWRGDPHLNPLHLLSNVIIGVGFLILASAWDVLYKAQREGQLATTGPYAQVRHPQYGGFILIMSGFLLQWPTLLTLVMFPVLVTMYVRLARREEREVQAAFGETYRRYAATTPAFVPRFVRPTASTHESRSDAGQTGPQQRGGQRTDAHAHLRRARGDRPDQPKDQQRGHGGRPPVEP